MAPIVIYYGRAEALRYMFIPVKVTRRQVPQLLKAKIIRPISVITEIGLNLLIRLVASVTKLRKLCRYAAMMHSTTYSGGIPPPVCPVSTQQSLQA